MDNILRQIVKMKIVSLKGTAFQDALDRIYACIYGNKCFQRVKQKRDDGSDGIVNGDTVLAAYAPESYSLRDFKKKIGGDFASYDNNWSETHSDWQVVTNLESTAQMIKFVNDLKTGASIICIEGLLQKISEQTWTVKTAIFRSLDIPEHYLTNDIVATVIEDLIQISDRNSGFEPYEKPAYIQDKIELNVSEQNWDSFSDEYEEALALFPIVSSVVRSRPQSKVAAIRSTVRTTYISLSGDFESRFAELVGTMAKNKIRDDYYVHNMRVVMLYFFEQCLYGQKPISEVGND